MNSSGEIEKRAFEAFRETKELFEETTKLLDLDDAEIEENDDKLVAVNSFVKDTLSLSPPLSPLHSRDEAYKKYTVCSKDNFVELLIKTHPELIPRIIAAKKQIEAEATKSIVPQAITYDAPISDDDIPISDKKRKKKEKKEKKEKKSKEIEAKEKKKEKRSKKEISPKKQAIVTQKPVIEKEKKIEKVEPKLPVITEKPVTPAAKRAQDFITKQKISLPKEISQEISVTTNSSKSFSQKEIPVTTNTSSVALTKSKSTPNVTVTEKKKSSGIDDILESHSDLQKKTKEFKQKVQQQVQIQRQQQIHSALEVTTISEEEHILYLDLIQKFHRDQQKLALVPPEGKPPTDLELTPEKAPLLHHLRIRVAKEQKNYHDYMFREALKNKAMYLILHPDIQKQITGVINFKREIIMKYPKYYDLLSAWDLRTIKVLPSDPILQYSATALENGRVLMWNYPPLNTKIPTDISYFTNSQETRPNNRWTKKPMPLLSEDPRIASLVVEHGVDIVVSSSTLCTLVDNLEPKFLPGWEIPVISRLFESNGKKQKAIILDKPLLQKKITPKEMNNYFYGKALQSMGLLSPKVQQGIQHLQPHAKVQTGGKTENVAKIENGGKNEEEEDEDNLTYTIWKFGDYKVLIRCKIHGMIEDASSKYGFRYLGMKTKMEYQLQRGIEEVTFSDIARNWIHTYIRPDAHLVLARIGVQDSVLAFMECLNMPGILYPGCLFKPEKSSKIIYTIFEKLHPLDYGSYLLTHKSEDHNLVLFRTVEITSSFQDTSRYYDLHEAHKQTPVTDIDTLPYNILKWNLPNQIPYTFPIDKNTRTTILELGVLTQYCPNYSLHGNCSLIGCGLKHSPIDPALKVDFTNYKFKGVVACFSYAIHGYCSLPKGEVCSRSHLSIEDIELKSKEKSRIKQLKNKEKEFVKRQKKREGKDGTPTDAPQSDLEFITNLAK